MKTANDNIILVILILSSLHLLYTSQHVAIAYQQVLPKSFSLIHKHYNTLKISQSLSSPASSANNNENIPISTTTSEKSIAKCYYQCGGGSGGGNKRWKQRIRLEELKVGQMIIGERIGKADLLNGKTGPKSEYDLLVFFVSLSLSLLETKSNSHSFYFLLVFFECGIGRIDHKNKWQMVSGMYRVAKNYAKPKGNAHIMK